MNRFVWHINGPLSIRVRVNQGIVTIKGYSTFPKLTIQCSFVSYLRHSLARGLNFCGDAVGVFYKPSRICRFRKVTNHTGLWDSELTWNSPSSTPRICRSREGDEQHWTVKRWARLILSEFYSPDLSRSWSWTILDC